MRQEEVRWTLLLHIRRAIWDHECPLTCSGSLQVTPRLMQRFSPTPCWKWDIAIPERMSAQANTCIPSWAAVSLKVRLTFKGFGSGMVRTVGTLWLGHRHCSSLGLHGSPSEIRPAWQSYCCRLTKRKWVVGPKRAMGVLTYYQLTLTLCSHYINADTYKNVI